MRVLLVLLAFLSVEALAATATTPLPALISHCNGTDIPPDKLDHYDLIHSTEPINIPATTPCTTEVQEVPDGVVLTTVDATAESISLEVDPTLTNYFSIRVCKAAVCSVFSEITVVLPVVAPEPPPEYEDQPYQPVAPSRIIITFDL